MRLLVVVALLASSIVFSNGYESRGRSVATGTFPYPANHPFLKVADDSNFRSLIVESTKPVIAAFYREDDGVFKNVAKNVESMALALRPLIDVVVMDGTKKGAQDLLTTYGVTNLPVILSFSSDLHPVPGAVNQWAKLPEGYQGDGSAGGLVRWALSKLSYTTVERVNDEHSLANFLSIHDHLHYPKVLLVTNDPSNTTAPLFLSMAQKMRKVAVFGVAHNCQMIIERYQITEFPTVLGFVPEDGLGEFTLTRMPSFPSAAMMAERQIKDAEAKTPNNPTTSEAGNKLEMTEAEKEEAKHNERDEARKERRNERLRKRGVEGADADAPSGKGSVDLNTPNLLFGDVEYEEALADYTHFEEWVNSIGIPEAKRNEYGMLIASEEEKFRDKAKEMAKWASAMEPIIVKDKATWEKSCLKMKQRGVCIIIFRDMSEFEGSDEDVIEKVNLEMYRQVSRKAAAKSPNTVLQLVIVDGTTNHELVSALGITNGVPDMVSIWPAKNKYYNFLGAINERNILNLFLDRTLKDKNGKKLPTKLPGFLKTGATAPDSPSGERKGPASDQAEVSPSDEDDSNVIGAGLRSEGDHGEDDQDL